VAKLSSVALPKAIDRLSAEIGGLTALQREVLSIIASPSLSSDVRHRATALLRQLHSAYSNDKSSRVKQSSTANPLPQPDPSAALAPLSDDEAQRMEKELEDGKLDDKVENTPVATGAVLRVHGIYMDRRREFEIRTGAGGKLELWDAHEKKLWHK